MKKYSHYDDLENAIHKVHNPAVPLSNNLPKGIKTPHEMDVERIVPVSVHGLLYTNVIQMEEFSSFMNGAQCMKQGEVASWNFYNRRKRMYETIYISNPLRYDRLEEFKEQMEEPILSPLKLPKNYGFKHAYISFYPSSEYTVALKQRRNQEGFEIVEACDFIQNYGVIYSDGFHCINVSVDRVAPNYQIPFSLNEEESRMYQNIEMIRIHKNLGMYRVLSAGSKQLVSENGQVLLKDVGGSQEICWLENRTTLAKIITNVESGISKNDLISMAQSMDVLYNERELVAFKM